MKDYFFALINKLSAAGISNPRLEARILIAAALNCSPAEVHSGTEIGNFQQKQLDTYVMQRLQHKPLDKIIGHREFYKFDFLVNENVLSPRPDSELLVEKALQYAKQSKGLILDLGAGSGCLIASVLLEKKDFSGTAVDISASALQIARKNAVRLGIKNRMNFLQADWFAADFLNQLPDKFDIIISNPPYIPTSDIGLLSEEVKNHDPLLALDGGVDGYDSYKRIAEIAPDLLITGGYLILEAGYDQSQHIADIFIKQKLQLKEICADLNNIPRCLVFQK